MIKYIRWIVTILTVGILMVNCRKKAFDEFYGRPENLAPPIYQQLETMGRFKNFLATIDKAGYKTTLSAAGYWTMFAPNDSAFGVFLKDRGLSSVDQLDSATCRKLVTYCLVYNAFDKGRLSDYQANTGWVQGTAFKRRTAYYEGFYDDTTRTGQRVKALASNRNGAFILGDNNNKHIPYFTDNFLAKKGLSAADYNYFFPNTPYTGFNVVDARALATDISAENGYIHEINKVVLPLPNIDRYLASKPEYSSFKRLFDKFLVNFLQHSEATTRYRLVTGQTGVDVFIKMFNPGLAFSPNNENYMKQQDNDAQSDGWTMFAPTNDVLKAYMDTVILEKYRVEENLPPQIIIDLMNAHMWQSSAWPSKFATTNNFQGEPARFNATTDIVDKKVLSNGLFYGTNKVQRANVFSTVYGKAYLDPKYLLMTRALDVNYRYQITVPTSRFNMVMMTDELLRARGFEFNTSTSAWTYTPPGTTTPLGGAATLQRILGNHIIIGDHNMIGGTSGIVETIGGELVKYRNDSLFSAGTPFGVKLDSIRNTVNGRVYYANDLLWYSSRTIGKTIDSLGGTSAAASPFFNFAQYLRNSNIYISSTGEITGVTTGVFYTFLIPDNDAILRAVAAGLLPKTSTGAPNFTPSLPEERELVRNFIYYHIIDKNVIGAGLEKSSGAAGTYQTLYKTISGDAKSVIVNNPANNTGNINGANMTVTDNYGKTVNVIAPQSNHLADRAVIHLISDYLRYNPQ